MKISGKIFIVALMAACLAGLWFLMGEKGGASLFAQGEAAFSRRDYQRAAALWKSALKHEPGSVQLRIRLGKAYWRLAKWESARKCFELALAERPEDSGLRIDLVRLLLLQGDMEAAEKEIRKLSSLSPDNPEVHLLWGDLFMLENRIKDALPRYQKALSLSSGEVRYLLKMAVCLHGLKKDHEAGAYFDRAQKRDNRSFQDFLHFADYYSYRNDDIRAESSLLGAVRLEPENLNVRMRLATLYLSTAQFDKALAVLEKVLEAVPESRDVQKAMADACISLNNFEKAEVLLQNLGDKNFRGDPELELLQGKFWLYQGNTAFAATHLKSAVDLVPGLTMGHYYLAVAYLASGQESLAENSLKSALLLSPDHPATLLLMAGILYKKRRYLLSLEYLERLMAKEPENHEAYLLKGLNLMELGAGKKAARALMAALAIDPANSSGWYYLGRVYERTGENRRAQNSYVKALELNPRLSDAAYHYAGVLIKSGKKDKALEAIDQLFGEKEKSPFLYYAAAMTAMNLDRNDLAAAYLEKAMDLEGDVPGYLVETLARVQMAMGRHDEARETLEYCTLHHSGHVGGWIALADYYRSLGFLNETRETLEKAKERLPESPRILGDLAWLYLETGVETDLALDFARGAYELQPQDPGIADTLGWAYFKKGAYAQAGWIFSEMEKQYPDNVLLLYHLGMTLFKQGKIPPAMERLNRALLLGAGEKETQTINSILAEINGREVSKKEAPVDFTETDILEPLKINPPEEEDILKPQWKGEIVF